MQYKDCLDERVLKKAQLPRFLLILSLQMKFAFGFDQPAHISLCIYQVHELSPFSSSYLLYFIIILNAVAGDSSCLKVSFFTLLITSDYSKWEKIHNLLEYTTLIFRQKGSSKVRVVHL